MVLTKTGRIIKDMIYMVGGAFVGLSILFSSPVEWYNVVLSFFGWVVFWTGFNDFFKKE